MLQRDEEAWPEDRHLYDSPKKEELSGHQQIRRLNLVGYFALGLNLLGLFASLSLDLHARRYMVFVLLVTFFSILYAAYLTRWCLSVDGGDLAMRRVSDAIREGSEGFLRIQYGTIARMALLVAGALFCVYWLRPPPKELEINRTSLAMLTALSFLLGSFCSAFAGYLGMWVGVRVNVRVASTAAQGLYSRAMLVAFRGGAIASIMSAALCVLGIALMYIAYFLIFVKRGLQATSVPLLMVGYGFGASFVALFMQLGGGIYTKAADVGADMIGKIDLGIPEDDPRNPAVIADLVGDNVGDCAGSMADVFESIAAEIIGTMILGSALAKEADMETAAGYMFFPLVTHALDLIISGIGIATFTGGSKMITKPADYENPFVLMKRSYAVSMFVSVLCIFATTSTMLHTSSAPNAWIHFAGCGMVGMVTAYMLIIITQYYTDSAFPPVQGIAQASTTGHGTNVIAGVSVGLISTGAPVLVLTCAILISYTLGTTSGLPPVSGGLYGTAVATMGTLCTAVFVLTMNNFGPIADNAGGIVEMSGQSETARAITDRLDAVGNITKAATKGFSIGGSALAAFILFRAYCDEMSAFMKVPFEVVNISRVEIMLGGLIAIAVIFVFTGLAIAAAGRTAQDVVREVRRQISRYPGIIDGTQRPEYQNCVAIVTKAALSQMLKPAVLALGAPVVVGLVFRFIGSRTKQPGLAAEVLASYLMFGTLTGLLMAIFMDNSGGAWDNAKKYIEAGAHGGKGSAAHKAAVTGDTVGDPFKDTAGPALHVIITTMSTTTLVLGPIFVSR